MPENITYSQNEDFLKIFKSALEDATSTKKAQQQNRAYSKIIDLCKEANMGQIVGRVVTDGANHPFRVINSYRELSYPVVDENGRPTRNRFRWMGSDNYKQITQDQRVLNDKLGTLLRQIDELKKANPNNQSLKDLWASYRSKFFMLYMKVKRLTVGKTKEVTSFDPPQMSLLTHRSARFGDILKSAIMNKSAAWDGDQWIEKCFSRNVENSKYVMIINTSRPQTGYEISINIDEVASTVSLTPEDLQMTENLDNELLSTTFDDARVQSELEITSEILDGILTQQGLRDGIPGNDLSELGAELPPLS